MHMRTSEAISRIENLFVDLHTLLSKDGLTWLLQSNQQVAGKNVLKAISPSKQQRRLQSDLGLSHRELKNDFSGFFAHSKRRSEAFVLIDGAILRNNLPKNDFNKATNKTVQMIERRALDRPTPKSPYAYGNRTNFGE